MNSSEDELFDIEEPSFSNQAFDYNDPASFSGVLRAVIENDLPKLKSLVTDKNYSVNITDNQGNTCLHVAVILQRTEIISYLINLEQTNLDAVNHMGETPLLVSTKNKQLDIPLLLLEKKANVNISTNSLITPLHYAIQYSKDITLALISNNACLNAQDYGGYTPIQEAVTAGSLEMLCLLLYFDADPNISCYLGNHPLMNCLFDCQSEIYQELIPYVTDFSQENRDKMNVTQIVISYGSEYVSEMLEQGVDVNESNNECFDALQLAAASYTIKTNKSLAINSFKLVWNQFDYKNSWRGTTDFFTFLLNELTKEIYFEIIKIVIESEKVKAIIERHANESLIAPIVEGFFHYKYELEELTKIVCILLSFGVKVFVLDIETVFCRYHYCQLFQVLLFMEIDTSQQVGTFLPSIIYNVGQKTNLQNMLKKFNFFSHSPESLVILVDYIAYTGSFDFSVFMSKVFANNPEYLPEFNMRLLDLVQVPSLKELSRNKFRDVFVRHYNIQNSCDFYTRLNCLHVLTVYKKIISLETPIYDKHENVIRFKNFVRNLKLDC